MAQHLQWQWRKRENDLSTFELAAGQINFHHITFFVTIRSSAKGNYRQTGIYAVSKIEPGKRFRNYRTHTCIFKTERGLFSITATTKILFWDNNFSGLNICSKLGILIFQRNFRHFLRLGNDTNVFPGKNNIGIDIISKLSDSAAVERHVTSFLFGFIFLLFYELFRIIAEHFNSHLFIDPMVPSVHFS